MLPLRAASVAAAAALIAAIGCANPGADTLERLIAHHEALIVGLERGDGAPQTIRETLATFERDRGADLARLRREVNALQRDLTAADRRHLRLRWAAARDALTTRLARLRKKPRDSAPQW